ncbi:MAG: hypothetical protein D8B56_01940 [Alloprevotella sp.]|nr:MAG: hypothetical protein D8B56_01940 [Alloprevotella sp.]
MTFNSTSISNSKTFFYFLKRIIFSFWAKPRKHIFYWKFLYTFPIIDKVIIMLISNTTWEFFVFRSTSAQK